jgi:uncharacterized protein YbjT (DUF2867 family)
METMTTAREPTHARPVLVTGATGYIGARLVPRLLAAGFAVRCLVRDRRKLASRSWSADPRVSIVEEDLSQADEATVAHAMRGCGAAYYLVHSMVSAGAGYAHQDRQTARTFARAADQAGLARLIYLGGLGEIGPGLSEHLASRREVERVLGSGGVPVTVLRAAMIIGSGSASFEILRYLVERLPVMITPKWVATECQPIAVRNVLNYLVACLSTPATVGLTLDIGGSEVVTYRELMRIMAEERGLPRRLVMPVPVLTPRLSALWIHLVTPLSRDIAAPLTEGLRNRVVCRDRRAEELMPQRLLTVREAIRAALDCVHRHDVESIWFDAGAMPGDPDWAGGKTFVDRREVRVEAPPDTVFRVVGRVGGTQGWYAANALWRIRGGLDRLFGGPGLRRGRRHPDRLAYGDAVDFWRVTDVEAPWRIALRAEMKLPGEAVLEFALSVGATATSTRLVQIATFKPKGLAGLAYWYAVMPLHRIVFDGMLKGIKAAAERDRSPFADSPSTAGGGPAA